MVQEIRSWEETRCGSIVKVQCVDVSEKDGDWKVFVALAA